MHIRTKGSHYIYEEGCENFSVPYHGAKEVGKGIEIKIRKQMDLK